VAKIHKNAKRYQENHISNVFYLGAIISSILIGLVTSIIQASDASRQKYEDKSMQIQEWMAFRRFPGKLRMRITDYYDHRFQGKSFDEQEILNELNPLLRLEVTHYNTRALLMNIPMFNYFDEEIVDFICENLTSESYLPGDMIVTAGGNTRGMHMISRGSVTVKPVEFSYVRQVMTDGDYFSELSLIIPHLKRHIDIQATSACHVYLFPHGLMDRLFKKFHQFRHQLRIGFLNYAEDMDTELAELPQTIINLVKLKHRQKRGLGENDSDDSSLVSLNISDDSIRYNV
jgi:hypothetical protein